MQSVKPFDMFQHHPQALKGVREKLNEWDSKGYTIILLTGRKASMRRQTIDQLESLGIFYDELVMGAGSGQRILINDLKPRENDPCNPTALAINVKRNEGIADINLDD